MTNTNDNPTQVEARAYQCRSCPWTGSLLGALDHHESTDHDCDETPDPTFGPCGKCGSDHPTEEHEADVHESDEECVVDPDTLACAVCGVDHSGPPCPSCGARAFYRSDCAACQWRMNGSN